MKRKIFKYRLEITKKQSLELPQGSQILSIQVQNNVPYLYALVNPDAGSIEYHAICIFATGQEVHYDMGIDYKYIGTFMLNDQNHPTGTFVGHTFEQL